jgi:hypothetical protein
MCCSLHGKDERPVTTQATPLVGTLVSSLHRLKDVNNEGMFRPPTSMSLANCVYRWGFLRIWRPLSQVRRSVPAKIQSLRSS